MSRRRRTRVVTEEDARQRLRINVRRAREAASLPVRQVAARAHIDRRHWQKIEAGEVNVTLHTLARVSIALGMDVVELLGEPPQRKPGRSE